MELNLDELDRPRQRWVSLGGFEILIRYSSPIETDRFTRQLTQQGIARFKDGRLQTNVGRDMDFYKALAEHYVLGWRGNITAENPEDTKYSHDRMARALASVGPLLEALKREIEEDGRFFDSAGSGSTPS